MPKTGIWLVIIDVLVAMYGRQKASHQTVGQASQCITDTYLEQDTDNLLKAKEVRCKKGHVLNSAAFHMQAKMKIQTRTTQTFCDCRMVKLYAISKLAQKVAAHDWHQESDQTRVEVLSDSLKGLIIVHAKGWMLRNISGENIDLIGLNPAKARLANYKKAIKSDISCEVDLGPAYLLPPEVSEGGYYSNFIDVYSLAMVFCSIAFPDAYEKHVDYTKPQGTTFRDEMAKCLKKMAYQTANLRDLTNAVKLMLSADPDERPTAAFVLSQIPGEISRLDYWAAMSLADEGPSRKKAKLRDLGGGGSGSLKYQSTAGSVTSERNASETSDREHYHDDLSWVESSAYVMSTTQTSDFTFGSEGGLPDLK